MSRSRFNPVFTTLMFIMGAWAFLVPPRHTNIIRFRIDSAFAPVAYPVRRLAQSVAGRLLPNNTAAQLDASTTSLDARQEIEGLRAKLASLTEQINALNRQRASREAVGDVYHYSSPFRVLGLDPSGRQAISIQASNSDNLTPGMPVVHANGLVGRVSSVGVAGAQVRLVTDRGFRMNGVFCKYRPAAQGKAPELIPVSTPTPLVEGRGNNIMSVVNLTLDDVKQAGLDVGDYVLLSDPEDWPILLAGYPIGRIERINPQLKSTLHAEIIIRSGVGLAHLREVMVVTGISADPAPEPPPPTPPNTP
jgi:cell shape-determining protein MreC